VRLSPDRAWATKEDEVGFTFRHTTANIGTKFAPRSRTGVEFRVSRHATRVPRSSFVRVPRIPRDQTRSGHHDFSVHFGSWDYGTTYPRICADLPEAITELDEANNCWKMKPFYVVPRKLSGPVRGSLVQDTATLDQTFTWRGPATFELRNSPGDGIFDYFFTTGTLTFSYKMSSTNGCTASGNGAFTPSTRGGIRVRFGANPRYNALRTGIAESFALPVTLTCPGVPTTTYTIHPDIRWWLYTGPDRRSFQDPGLERLLGGYSNSTVPEYKISYRWNLAASG